MSIATISKTSEKVATILLVEDDYGDQELTRRALEAGKIKNNLFVVENGEEALDFLFHRGKYEDPETSPRPDLILLDLNMPRMDGRQVLEVIRGDPKLRNLVVIVLTTSSHEEDVLRSYDVGANSFITKPVVMDQFISAVKDIENYWFQVVVLPPDHG